MDVYLKKYFWTLGIIVTAVCAMLAGKGVTNVVEARYLLVDADAGRSAPVHAQKSPRRDRSGKPLADRNLFCAACEPPRPEVQNPIETDSDEVPMTSLPLQLVATNVSPTEAFSFGTIRNRETDRQGAYWLAEAIPSGGQIVRITGEYVDFVNESESRIERISLLGDDAARSEPTPARRERREPRERPSGRGENDLHAQLDEGIRETGENAYELERELVDHILANPAQVARGVRIVPSIRDGQANGFKLYALRPSSVFAKIGLMNGDTISEINGFDLSTPDKALEVYERVRDANNLTVTVDRRGERVTLRYSIR